ncbi:hypothetical protein LCGC14_0542250 [marine sediment metagenome]|uniref:HNH nuclease domain-containing protein n=1 Tax=marine sediment metagenome TaxID=412755 RepID=A0A0F9RSG4_9ZZZZ
MGKAKINHTTDNTDRITPIPGFPGYFVSRDGFVWSNYSRKWLRYSTYRGLRRVRMMRRGKRCVRPVHRIVLETYVSLCPDGMQGRHLDGDKTNNKLGNLCWGTPKESGRDNVLFGTLNYGEYHPAAKLTEVAVRLIRKFGGEEGELNQRRVAELFNISQTAVNKIVNYKTWRHVE